MKEHWGMTVLNVLEFCKVSAAFYALYICHRGVKALEKISKEKS